MRVIINFALLGDIMSFLKDENEVPPKFIGLSDLLTLIVIAALGAGGYYYFDWAKKDSEVKLEAALKVLETGTRVEAYKAFSKLENLQYRSDSLDSIIYEKQSVLIDISENQKILFETIEDKLEVNDSTAFVILMKEWKGVDFLPSKRQVKVEAWKAEIERLKAPKVDTTSQEKK